jgi:hypothetical protein
MNRMKAALLTLLFLLLSVCGDDKPHNARPGTDNSDQPPGPPVITMTVPVSAATGVFVAGSIAAHFNKNMDAATLTETTFTLMEALSSLTVSGSLTYDAENKIVTFVPSANLKFNTEYTATLSEGAKDFEGNALVVPAIGEIANPWKFRTAPAPGELAINLGGIEAFGIASRAGLNSTGVTVIDGDVALFPLASCTDATGNAGASQPCLVKTYASATGLTVNGSIYFAGDLHDNGQTAEDVTEDLQAAWLEAKNQVTTRAAIAAGELGGKTYAPGVYSNANLGLAAGSTATLDANNDANAVFIFKIDSDFVDSGTLLLPTEIKLVRGAQARNVWFVAGRDITLGSGTKWNGNILAGRDATVNDGSTVNGRVLAGASGAGAIVLTGAASPSVTRISVP